MSKYNLIYWMLHIWYGIYHELVCFNGSFIILDVGTQL